MPKWITKPAPVEFSGACPMCRLSTHPAGSAISFDEFLPLLLEDARFGSGIDATRASKAIKVASSKCADGDRFVINDNDHATMIAILYGPSGRTWIPSFMNALDAFVVAIESAASE